MISESNIWTFNKINSF